jgi:hypothetical protein
VTAADVAKLRSKLQLDEARLTDNSGDH